MANKRPPGKKQARKEHSASRRLFIKSVGVTGVTAAASSCVSLNTENAQSNSQVEADAAENSMRIAMTVNGEQKELAVTPNTILLDALRNQLNLTGTKKGCDHGQCGACNVHVNGQVVNSCLSLAVMHDGDDITTVEGLGSADNLSAVQQAFLEHDAYQCGYCTAGQMMTADYVLRSDHIASDDAAVREAMSGNICRCGAYKNILAAVQTARGRSKT